MDDDVDPALMKAFSEITCAVRDGSLDEWTKYVVLSVIESLAGAVGHPSYGLVYAQLAQFAHDDARVGAVIGRYLPAFARLLQ